MRETLISFAANAALSVGFFIALFGWNAGRLAWGAPDQLALDFLPQAAIVVLMSGAVPLLIARRALGLTAPAAMVWRAAVRRVPFGLAVGGAAALAARTMGGSIDWPAALALKTLAGGTLGAMVTWRAISVAVGQWQPR